MSTYLPGMRRGYRIFSGVLAVAMFACLSGCQKTAVDDQVLIQQQLQKMALAIEKRQVAGFLEGVHEGFLGQGRLRKANLAGLLLLHLRQHQSISVSLSNTQIQLNGDQQATVILETHLSGNGGWLGQGQDLRIQSRWQKVADAWLVERARWQMLH